MMLGLGQETTLTPITPASGDVTVQTIAQPLTYNGPECDPSTLLGTINSYLGRCTALMISQELAAQNLGPGASAETQQSVITTGIQTAQNYLSNLATQQNCPWYQTQNSDTNTCANNYYLLGAIAAVVVVGVMMFQKRGSK